MSLWSRLQNVFGGDRLSREIDDELEAHIADAIEHGRDPAEAQRAFGSLLLRREQSRDIRIMAWLDSLRADAVFGWRQLVKRKVTSIAAVLSLALAIGSCTSAFRLIDALLLRPLPVSHPEQLYFLARQGIGPEGKPQNFDSWAYPAFHQMRAAVKGRAELIAISESDRFDLTYSSDEQMEKAYLQYVSGSMFESFGLRPALGRLLSENDDLRPGAHPYAVLSYDYWSRRFGRDPNVIGRTFRFGDGHGGLFEIVGVAGERFTGIEPGTVIDIFAPTMMHPWVQRSDATWMRTIARVQPGVAIEPLRQQLNATSRAFEADRARSFTNASKQRVAWMLNQTVYLETAAAGISGLQRSYRVALMALGVLVALVLLIACANIANLMTAQAAARAREMALRVSIGAGRGRLVQLVLVESGMLALAAAAAGGAFAWWSAPFVVGKINPADNPARLVLPADWRVLGFGVALTLAVTILFGVAPALRASAVKPAGAMRGGDDPHSRRRLMHTLIAAQVAFCFLVLFVAGLFVATFDRLAHRPTGFSAERLLVADAVTARPQDPALWEQVADRLRALPGVETVALSDWALMNGNSRNNLLSFNGGPPTDSLSYFRYIAPGWLDTLKIPVISGRGFRAGDTSPGEAIVNQAFAKAFFNGEDPVGKSFDRGTPEARMRYQIVGLVRDVTYRSLREPILPIAFVPFRAVDANGASKPVGEGTFILRTSASNPMSLASTVRHEVAAARPGFRVSNIRSQEELNLRQTVRERLLATLALFFAGVALLLAGIGLYGVLDYSVLQRRREIGIRMAIGAQAGDIARRVTADAFAMVIAGAVAGVLLGMMSARYIASLFYQVKSTDMPMLALPAVLIVLMALLAELPAVIRAVRIDPVSSLRSE
jgi:putative ABC transport system permease protein